MVKVKTLELAKSVSASLHMSIGLCVTDGCYYVGSEEDLKKIPTVLILIRRIT